MCIETPKMLLPVQKDNKCTAQHVTEPSAEGKAAEPKQKLSRIKILLQFGANAAEHFPKLYCFTALFYRFL